MHDTISVIIPVYKAEKYLQACVESVLSQSYTNLEVILVDDGSPDGCPAICDRYAEKDSRVRVIHKLNGGASSARNAGLAAASGVYISFVDSDDILAPDGLRALCSAMERTRAAYGAGICKIMGSSSSKNSISEERYTAFQTEPQTVLQYITQSGSYSPYAKMYRGDIIRAHHLRYDETLKCSEDALFVRQYLLHCSDMVLVPDVVYEYNTANGNSLSKKGYELFCEYYVEKLKVLEQLCDKLPITEQEKIAFMSYRAVHGLRICADHYLKHWQSPEKQFELIDKSVRLLKPWIDASPDTATAMDRLTATWWHNKRDLIENARVQEYYTCVLLEAKKKHRWASVTATIKRTIKKWIGQ